MKPELQMQQGKRLWLALLAILSMLRRESPRWFAGLILTVTGIALAWLPLNKPG